MIVASLWFAAETVDPRPWGLRQGLFLSTAALLTLWYSLDTFFARRTLYAWFGTLEGTLKHGLRFWRRIATLTLAVAGMGYWLVVIGSADSGTGSNASETPQQLAALAVALLASFGWMYTRYEQEKSDRAKATLEAIRDQMYGQRIADTYRSLQLLSAYCVKTLATPPVRPFNAAELALRLETVAADVKPSTLASVTHGEAADQFINALNQLAFGVRNGQFDLDTIALVLRPRFIRIAFRYHNLIVESTDATLDPRLGRMRAQKRTWEHFLWLTTKMDVLKADKVSFEYICLPPDHIIGNRKGELLPPPQSRTGGLFRLDWDRIDSAMRKLAGR